MTVNFVTAWVGKEFDISYVINLYNGLKRNISSFNDFKFTVITDKPGEILKCDAIEAATFYANPDIYPGWWSKMLFFNQHFTKAIFFDLDTVITGNIDKLARGDFNGETKFAILENFLQPPVRNPAIKDPCRFGSAVMWKSPYSKLYSIIEDLYFRDNQAVRMMYDKNGGDQKFIEHIIDQYDLDYRYIQDFMPTANYFRSVKYPENLVDTPIGNRVMCYHGKPRPHEDLGNKIIQDHWR